MSVDPAPTPREQLERDGYVLLEGLFAEAEIDRLKAVVSTFFARRGVLYHLGKTQPNAAIEVPDLAFLFADPKVVTAFQDVLGERGILFTGHCDIHQDIFSNWHKDTGGDGYFSEDCYVPDCRVYKMAVYLQDHDDGRGLTVRPGSHRGKALGEGEGVSLKTKAGDAVIFDVRLSHRGRLPEGLDKGLHLVSQAIKRGLGPLVPALREPGDVGAVYQLKRAWEALVGRPSKMSVFFTFGAPNRFSRQFAEANMARQLRQYAGAGASAYPPGLVERLGDLGVDVYLGEVPAPVAAA